jgi:ribosomal protein S18 acetylase RimI-like enzyme
MHALMELRIVELHLASRELIEWAAELAVNNISKYVLVPMLKHSKLRSLRNKENNYVVCYDSSVPVGFITFRFSGVSAFVYELHVEEKYRLLGVGSKLLAHCKSMYSDVVARVVLYVHRTNVGGVQFYRKNGFCVNKRYASPRFYEMVFEKRI